MRIRSAAKASRPLFLSFSGIDGAGKSTQINALCASLLAMGLRVRVIPFWDEVACLTSFRENAGHALFKGDKGVGSPSAPIERRDKNVRAWPMTCFRFLMYLLDAISASYSVSRLRSSDFDVVIFDRYVYDELANLDLRNPVVSTYARMILKITPHLDVSYLLDANPEAARARKPEYPIDFIRINQQSYRALADMVNGMICIPPMGIEEVCGVILERTVSAFSLSGNPREAIEARPA